VKLRRSNFVTPFHAPSEWFRRETLTIIVPWEGSGLEGLPNNAQFASARRDLVFSAKYSLIDVGPEFL